MVIIIDHDRPCLYAFSAVEGRPALSRRSFIDFVSLICNFRVAVLRLQWYRSLGVERFRPRTPCAITFALKAATDTIVTWRCCQCGTKNKEKKHCFAARVGVAYIEVALHRISSFSDDMLGIQSLSCC